MRVALVHYWLVTMRGGEKVLESLCRMYPQADIYTHVLDPECLSPCLQEHTIYTTFINDLPCAKKHYKKYLPLMPMALEKLDLTEYDLVISFESGPSKGVITRADALHVCYCHTPMRYLWDLYAMYYSRAGFASRIGMRLFTPYLRRWDVYSSHLVDDFVANSATVARRIQKRWRRKASVIYPPVDIDAFPLRAEASGEYYVCMGQLVHYKRVDIAVDACTRMGRKLIVIGEGEDMADLQKRAGSCVQFVGRKDHAGLVQILSRARALLFPAEEDFGIVPLEASASGVPVLAYKRGGATETVVDGLNGMFFEMQNAESLMETMTRFELREKDFDGTAMRAHAEKFSEQRFMQEMSAHITQAQQALCS